MDRGASKAPGSFQRMCFGNQTIDMLNLQHGIRAAIQPCTVFNRGEIRLRGCLIGKPIEIQCESAGLYRLHAQWCHTRFQQIPLDAHNVCRSQSQQTDVRPTAQQSVVQSLARAITLKPMLDKLHGKTLWIR